MERAEVVVVGLGAMGSSAVYQLAATGTRVVGIDQYSPPHPHGSTHGDTRITRLAVGEGDAYVPFVTRSHEIWRELQERSGTALLHEVGGLIIAPADGAGPVHGAEDFFATTVRTAQRHRVEHRVLRAEEITREFPQFRPDGHYVGFHEPSAGYVLAEESVRVQLELAERAGAVLRRGERVLDVRPTRDGVTVRTDRETYTADVAVLTAGPWLPELVEPDIASLFTIHRQILVWFDVEEAARPSFAPTVCPVFIWPFGSGVDDVFYGFPAVGGPGGGVKVGTEAYGPAVNARDGRHVVQETEAAAMFERCLRGRMAGLRPAALRSASCLYTVTPDFGFVIDRHPEHRNVILASPCSGHGFKHAPAVGEAVAQLATAGTSTFDVTPFALARFADHQR